MVAADQDQGVRRPSIAKAVIGLFLAAVFVLGGWIVLVGGFGGGEPYVVVDIPPESSIATDPGDLAMRQTVPPGATLPGEAELDPIAPQDIRIIDPSDAFAEAEGPGELPRAPFQDLAEATEYGLLPRVGQGGRTPASEYARPAPPPFTGPGAPVRIALMVTGLGISASGTSTAISRLPADISLAFAPYGSDLQTWVDRARDTGHEVFLQLPMEPFDYPDNDPGPHTLLSTLADNENIDRLQWLLARFTGYTGVTNYMGAKLTSDEGSLRPVMAELSERGLSYLDDGTSSRSVGADLASSLGTPSGVADISIDADSSREEIIEALTRLEALAAEHGRALGVVPALPIAIDIVSTWSEDTREKGILLVPASSLLADG